MTERMNLNMEDLEMVNGGDQFETGFIAFWLKLRGYGNFIHDDGRGKTAVDVDGMADFFESRGWTFIPSEDGANLYVDNNGLRYDHYKLMDVITNKKL